MRSPFTGLGSNIDPDEWHAQKSDREREATEFPDCPLCGRPKGIPYGGICPACKRLIEADDILKKH